MTCNVTLARHDRENIRSRSAPAIGRRRLLNMAAGVGAAVALPRAVSGSAAESLAREEDVELPTGAHTWLLDSSSALQPVAPDNRLHGLVTETLCSGEASTVPGKTLSLMRLTLHPGTTIGPQSHPGPIALYVESGVVGTELLEGWGTVERAPVDGMWEAWREMTAGDEARLSAGDRLFVDGAVLAMRNDGDERSLLLVSMLVDTGTPTFTRDDSA